MFATRGERIAGLLRAGHPAYTSTPGWIGYSDAKLTALSARAVADGFTQIKLKVGADVRRMAVAREAVGPDIRIVVDANQRWGVAQAQTSIAALAPWGPYWVEEPTSPDEILGLAAIKKAVTPVKIAVGEHVANRVIFKQILQAGAADVLTIDGCRVAGVNENVAILRRPVPRADRPGRLRHAQARDAARLRVPEGRRLATARRRIEINLTNFRLLTVGSCSRCSSPASPAANPPRRNADGHHERT